MLYYYRSVDEDAAFACHLNVLFIVLFRYCVIYLLCICVIVFIELGTHTQNNHISLSVA